MRLVDDAADRPKFGRTRAPISHVDETSRRDIGAGEPAAAASQHGSRLRNYFLTGLILVGPLYITVNLTWWFITWVDDLCGRSFRSGFRTETYLPFRVPGSGLIVALLALTLLGFLTANLVGRTLVEFGENLLNRMPIVRPIYKTLKQIFETLFSKSGSSFRKVGAGRISARHVVAGVSVAAADPGHCARGCRSRTMSARVHAVHAQPDHRVLLLRARAANHRARHFGRGGHDAADVGRHGAAQRRAAEEAGGDCRRRARRPCHGLAGGSPPVEPVR